MAAFHPPRREPGAVAVARGDHRVRREHLELQSRPGAAAPPAGPAGVRGESVPEDLDRHFGLVDLDWRVLEEGEVRARSLGPVPERDPAGAAGDGIQVRHQEPAGTRVRGAHVDERPAVAAGSGHDVGERLRERAEHARLKPHGAQAAHSYRGGVLRIDQRPLGDDAARGAQQPGVQQHRAVHRVHHVHVGDHQQHVAGIAPGRDVQR